MHTRHNIQTKEEQAGWGTVLVRCCTCCGKSGIELREECVSAKIVHEPVRAVWCVCVPPQMGGRR